MSSEEYKGNKIEIEEMEDHYRIYVNGAFKCSCHELEIREEIKEIKENL